MSPSNPESRAGDRKSGSSASFKANHNSLPKKSHLEFVDDVSTSRSRSSDNLAKFPASSVSPLARRIANFESSNNDSGIRNDSDKSNRNSKIGLDCRPINENDSECDKSDRDSTCKSPMNVDLIPNSSKTFAKSPIFQRESKDLSNVSEQSSTKPRRWSMVDNANNKSVAGKDGDGLAAKMTSQSVTVATHDPLQEPDYPPEKKSVRELAASLIKQSPESQSKLETGFNLMRLRNGLPTPFIQKSPTGREQAADGKNLSPGAKENG